MQWSSGAVTNVTFRQRKPESRNTEVFYGRKEGAFAKAVLRGVTKDRTECNSKHRMSLV